MNTRLVGLFFPKSLSEVRFVLSFLCFAQQFQPEHKCDYSHVSSRMLVRVHAVGLLAHTVVSNRYSETIMMTYK